MVIAERLKTARGLLSQKAAAIKCGIKQQAWNSYEKGSSLPGAEAIQNICISLGVSADWLLGLPERGTTVTAQGGVAINGSGNRVSGTIEKSNNPKTNCDTCPYKALAAALKKVQGL